MKCPGNPEHEGINAIVQSEDGPHYAGAWCQECKLWIKWMSRKDYEAFRKEEDAGGVRRSERLGPRRDESPRPEPLPGVLGKPRVLNDGELEQIREIVREEIKKARES